LDIVYSNTKEVATLKRKLDQASFADYLNHIYCVATHRISASFENANSATFHP